MSTTTKTERTRFAGVDELAEGTLVTVRLPMGKLIRRRYVRHTHETGQGERRLRWFSGNRRVDR